MAQRLPADERVERVRAEPADRFGLANAEAGADEGGNVFLVPGEQVMQRHASERAGTGKGGSEG
jgi:hypothetical protein